MADNNATILIDGQQSFEGGVDSSKTTTLASELLPEGLQRNQLSWLINATTRNGGITCRNGWSYRALVSDGSSLFQGGYVYEPLGANPYLVALIGGVLYRINLEDPYDIQDLTGGNPALLMPTSVESAFFVQGEQFLVVQAGDYTTLPLFWDGAILRRSIGITTAAVAPGTPGVNELPAAGPMDYYMGRIWYANRRNYAAGDIVGGNSGTIAYGFRDSILNVTENPLVLGGDGFTVPTNAGNIRALRHGSNIDTALGQSQLFIFTRKQIYSLDVPVTRTAWIAATNDNQPLQKVVQFVNGAVNDRSIVAVNSDLFFQSLEPSIRSLTLAVRYYQQWGNTQISSNEERILNFNDRSLMYAATGIEFANRLWQGVLPKLTNAGVAHQAVIPLDFEPISSFSKKANPAWEGHYEGLDILQMFKGDFGGLEKAFGLIVSRTDSSVQLWEFTESERFNYDALGGDNRIDWVVETPAYTFAAPHKLKRLVGGEMWVDRAYGTVTVKIYYRPDADPCWILWHRHEFCVTRNTCEDVVNPVCYPIQQYAEGYRWPIVFPMPPAPCDSMHVRPANVGYQFQLKIEVTGWCRIRSILVYANEVPKGIYHGLTVQNTPPDRQALNVIKH